MTAYRCPRTTSYELNKVFDAPDDCRCPVGYLAGHWRSSKSEIVYLAVEDVDLQNKSVAIRPNSLRGSLKTASSERTIPLSDKALEALQVLRQGKEADEAIFTRYARPRGADSAISDVDEASAEGRQRPQEIHPQLAPLYEGCVA